MRRGNPCRDIGHRRPHPPRTALRQPAARRRHPRAARSRAQSTWSRCHADLRLFARGAHPPRGRRCGCRWARRCRHGHPGCRSGVRARLHPGCPRTVRLGVAGLDGGRRVAGAVVDAPAATPSFRRRSNPWAVIRAPRPDDGFADLVPAGGSRSCSPGCHRLAGNYLFHFATCCDRRVGVAIRVAGHAYRGAEQCDCLEGRCFVQPGIHDLVHRRGEID